MTAALVEADDAVTCWDCGGPCATYKGSVHGWRCTGCLGRYLDEGAARGAERDRRERDRNQRKLFRGDTLTTNTVAMGRRRGEVAALCTAPSPDVDQLREGNR